MLDAKGVYGFHAVIKKIKTRNTKNIYLFYHSILLKAVIISFLVALYIKGFHLWTGHPKNDIVTTQKNFRNQG